jgi:hypothetical protein
MEIFVEYMKFTCKNLIEDYKNLSFVMNESLILKYEGS